MTLLRDKLAMVGWTDLSKIYKFKEIRGSLNKTNFIYFTTGKCMYKIQRPCKEREIYTVFMPTQYALSGTLEHFLNQYVK